jgi:uncharacterized protein (DUF302 family)
MAAEWATTTYLVRQPFDLAVKSLRKVLAEANLKLAGELDMSSRIRRRLLIGTAPCHLFFVAAAPAAFEELGSDPCAAALTPLHIVVSARGSQTEVHLLRALPAHQLLREQPTRKAFREVQARIAQAIERIGMRSTLGA